MDSLKEMLERLLFQWLVARKCLKDCSLNGLYLRSSAQLVSVAQVAQTQLVLVRLLWCTRLLDTEYIIPPIDLNSPPNISEACSISKTPDDDAKTPQEASEACKEIAYLPPPVPALALF